MKKIKCPVCGYESPIGTEICPVCKVDLAKVADNRTVTNDEGVQSWSVLLLDAGASKISTIKIIREITGLGLKETKELINNPPQVIISGIPEIAALQLEQDLISAGANVIITRTTKEEQKQKSVEVDRLKHEDSITKRETANLKSVHGFDLPLFVLLCGRHTDISNNHFLFAPFCKIRF